MTKRMESVVAIMFLTAGAAVAQEPVQPFGMVFVDGVNVGPDYTLPEGETVGQIEIRGGSAAIHGAVQGDVDGFGSFVITVTGSVGGDLHVVIGEATIAADAVIDGDLNITFGRVTIDAGAVVNGDLNIANGVLHSPPEFEPGGAIVAVNARINDEPINYDADYWGFGSDSPLVGTPTWAELPIRWVTRGPLTGRLIVPDMPWTWGVVGIVLALALGLNLVFDTAVRAGVGALGSKPLTTGLIGLLVLALVGPVLLMLTVSVVGVIVVPVVFAALAAAGVMGSAAVSRWFGGMVLPPASAESRLLGARSLLIGFAIICVALMGPVLGLVSGAGIAVLGLGAASVAVAETFRRENPAPAPPTSRSSASAAGTRSSESRPEDLPPVDAASFPIATFPARAGAFVLDFLLVALIYGMLGLDALRWFFALLLGYHIACWSWSGATVGGVIAGVRVVRSDHRPLTFSDALVRGLSSVFSAAVLGLGFFWILKDPDGQSWHDKIAGTAVVMVPGNRKRS